MKYKHLYAAHELRMTIVQIVIPGIALGYTIWSNPEARFAIKRTANNIKYKFKKAINHH